MDWSEAEISILVERLNLISRLSGGEVSDAIVKSVDLITSLRLQTSELASAPLDMDASPLAVEDVMMRNQSLAIENALLRAERDEARLQMGRIFNEIDCRIEHGADSNGHLEAIRNLFGEHQ